MLSDEQSEYGRRLIRDLLSGNMDSAAEIQRELTRPVPSCYPRI